MLKRGHCLMTIYLGRVTTDLKSGSELCSFRMQSSLADLALT